MALKIEHPAVEELARELAMRTGETIEEAVAAAIRERLEREQESSAMHKGDRVRDPVVEEIVERMRQQPLPDPQRVSVAIREIQESLAKLPVLDPRTPDEILGYDESGLPH
jgi:antitoxin VapB